MIWPYFHLNFKALPSLGGSKFIRALGFIILSLLLFAFGLIAIPIGLICALGGLIIAGLVFIFGAIYLKAQQWFNRGKI